MLHHLNIYNKIHTFLTEEAVLTIAGIVAIISMFWVPPDLAYVEYINFDVLAILFCLMAVVSGLIRSGLFNILSQKMLTRTKDLRLLSILLTMSCFFGAMLVTNDVALITFVPLTLTLLRSASSKRKIFIIVMETVAANLGSMLTPIGNPQNLFLYSYYQMNIEQFFRIVAPTGFLGGLLILFVLILARGGQLPLEEKIEKAATLNRKLLLMYMGLFLLAILGVLRFFDVQIVLVSTLLILLLFDRVNFSKVDYALLATFVAFFIFVGNLGRIDAIRTAIAGVMQGRELLVAVFTSQVISNVPAAIMLSGFTDQVRELLLGVNIGGLGTLIASLASLIAYKLYMKSEAANSWHFLGRFSLINVLMLLVLLTAVEWGLL